MPNWVNPTSRAQIESALDKHMLYGQMQSGAFWLLRRNGCTKTWKTRPGEFQIPVKCGFSCYGTVHEDNSYPMLRIAASREDAEHA